MQGLTAELLRGLWYVAMPSADLPARTTRSVEMLGERVLVGRGGNGAVFAIRDVCPHQAMPLRYGRFDGETIECAYHGWRFGQDGACVAIPSLCEGHDVDLATIRVQSYPCVERQGLVWVYFAAAGEAPIGDQVEPPRLPVFADGVAPSLAVRMTFSCSADHAAFGLMDPAHAAYVHTSWWFKRQARKLRPKEKIFEPSKLGWKMARHELPPQNLAYKLLGRNVSTEITYRLPGLRIEEIRGEAHAVVGLTALTPITDQSTEVHQMFWATARWVKPLAPLGRRLMMSFLDQDRRVAGQQREGLLANPKMMLVKDANTQARWWMHLKDEWTHSIREGRPFRNPVTSTTLRWMS